ncbi:MAG: hypothetical protein IPG61_10575 [bacterium]|nr:hypothetical protein [bacterium]
MTKLAKILIVAALVAISAGSALAMGVPNSAVVIPRVFNDAPFSNLTVDNSYPSMITITDEVVPPAGWANLHVWRLSQDSMSPMQFANNDGFAFGASVRLSGNGEAGIQLTPWWSEADGRFNIRTPDGEVAVFGGRLPFYSFTANHGKSYVGGTWVHMTMIYRPNQDMDASNPATIEYIYDDGIPVSSGQLPFDEGNPSEDPPHGLWGILNFAHAGGYVQFNNMVGSPAGTQLTAEYCTFTFQDLGAVVGVDETSWGGVKALFR